MAIKFLERGERINERYVGREIFNHSQLLHPHIVQFKEVFLTPHYLGICMEYAEVRLQPCLAGRSRGPRSQCWEAACWPH